MAHMVYKKPLQNQTTRDNYIKQRQELRQAKEQGILDTKSYQDAKKNLLAPFDAGSDNVPQIRVGAASSRKSASTSSAASTISSINSPGSPRSETRKGTILDRNNVARLVYKPEAQSRERRDELRALRKAQKKLAEAERFSRLKDYQHQLNEADEDGGVDTSRFAHLTLSSDSLSVPARVPTAATSTSNSSVSGRSTKSQRMTFNIFRKRSNSTSRHSPPPLPPPGVPPIPLLSHERPLTKEGRRPGSSSTSGSSMTRRYTESRSRGGDAILDALPMTFADIFLMGPPPSKPPSRPSSRRRSFSSQNARPSFSSSRRSSEAPVELIIRKAREEFVFESRPPSIEISSNSPLEASPHQDQLQPQEQHSVLSTVLQEIFLSLLKDFSNTSVLFSYPKHGRIRRDSFSSSFRSIPRSPRINEEEIGRAIGGEESFYIDVDESTELLKTVLEKRAWFLMAMKWLSFGRVLFSPGHHLIDLSGEVEIGMGRPDASILDLDGAVTADWSWHLADEFPFATIFNILLPHSPRPPRNSTAPPNLHFITAPNLRNLSALPPNSIDVITSHSLPRLLTRDKNQTPEELLELLTAVLRECARILKPSGYFEMTIVDPIMNNMGPRTRNWIVNNVAPLHNMKPSKMILAALEQLSGKGKGMVFDEVKECWMWMPTTSIGDELSTVTSTVGRYLYDQLYVPEGEEGKGQDVEVAYGVFQRKECNIWNDEKVIEECQRENTAFRWLKCYARKV